MNSPLPFSLLVCGLTSAALASAAPAHDPAAAEVLFQEARDLLEAGNSAEACPKFEESQRLDPATGTLIAVANCHETQGRLATAWSEYTEVAALARSQGRVDRVRLAEARAEGLLPRLSKATIGVSDGLAAIEGLTIQRDGIELGPMSLNRALPIDQGEHIVRLTAPGYETVNVRFAVGGEAERVRVEMPMLQEAEVRSMPGPVRPASGSRSLEGKATSPGRGLSGTQELGVWVGSAGIASLAVAGGFMLSGLNKKQDASALCDENQLCDAPGDRYLDTAVSRANTATYFALGGWALLATGVTLYVVGDEEEPNPIGKARGPRSALVLQGLPGGAGLQWAGEF